MKGGQLLKIKEEIYKGTYKWFEYNTLSGPTADGTRMREVAKTCSPNHRCKLAVQREEENLIYYQMVMMMELTSDAYMDESSGKGLSRHSIENMVLCVVST